MSNGEMAFLRSSEARDFDRADNATSGSREDGSDRLPARFASRQQPSVRLHNRYFVRAFALQFAKIAIHERGHVRVDDSSAGALEIRGTPGETSQDAETKPFKVSKQGAFVSLIVLIGVQKANGDGLRTRSLELLAEHFDIFRLDCALD